MLKNLSMRMKVGVRILSFLVWSKLLYGCAAWTTKKDLRRNLDVTEMWFIRQMLKIPWTNKVTTEEESGRAELGRELISNVEKRELQLLVTF